MLDIKKTLFILRENERNMVYGGGGDRTSCEIQSGCLFSWNRVSARHDPSLVLIRPNRKSSDSTVYDNAHGRYTDSCDVG
jgi:hypothetical protein